MRLLWLCLHPLYQQDITLAFLLDSCSIAAGLNWALTGVFNVNSPGHDSWKHGYLAGAGILESHDVQVK